MLVACWLLPVDTRRLTRRFGNSRSVGRRTGGMEELRRTSQAATAWWSGRSKWVEAFHCGERADLVWPGLAWPVLSSAGEAKQAPQLPGGAQVLVPFIVAPALHCTHRQCRDSFIRRARNIGYLLFLCSFASKMVVWSHFLRKLSAAHLVGMPYLACSIYPSSTHDAVP